MTLADIADRVFRIPELEWAYLQQHEALEERNGLPIAGNPGVKQKTVSRKTEYRATIRHAGKFWDCSKPKVSEALDEAFHRTGINLIAKIDLCREGLRNTKARTAKDTEEAARFERAVDEYRATIAALTELQNAMSEE